ncbi:MAG: hypothetical protein IPM60_03750 [Rhodospirillales bacterium]|nr:hypothetical protein [Rhodospirillales bacterium]
MDRARRRQRPLAGVVASGALVGCSSTPDSTADQGPIRPSSAEGAAPGRGQGQAQATYAPPGEVPGAGKPFPNLADVPERPAVSTAEQRAKLEQALVADRARRRYSGDVIVLQGPVLETPAPTAMPPPPPSLADAGSAAAPAGSTGMTLPSTSASAPSMDDTAIAAVPATPSLAPAEAPPPAPTLPAVEAPTSGAQRSAESALPSPAEQFLRAARETSEEATASIEVAEPMASVSFVDGGSRLAEGEEDTLRDIAARYGRTGGSVRVIGRGGPGGQTGARVRADAVAGALARLGVPEASIAISAEDVAASAAGGEGAGGRADIYLAP